MGGVVLVTGAAGFVGSAVARALIARGETLRVLVRPSSARTNIVGLDAEVVVGDLGDPASLEPALRGVTRLYHVAADYRLWARDAEEIVRNNRDGTAAIMRAAQGAGVERIVYCSSVATLSLEGLAPGAASDETRPLAAADAIGAYKRSKVVAERVVERMVVEAGLPAVIVNPSTPIGPRDVKPTPTGRIVVEAATGRMPAFVDTGLNIAHVDDIAAGHLLAMDRGRIGERYVLGGQDVELRALLAEIARLSGRKPPTVALPRGPLFPLAAAAEAVAHVTGKEPFVTRDALKMSAYKMFFSSAKAEHELGYVARPWTEAVRDAYAWFADAGYLRR